MTPEEYNAKAMTLLALARIFIRKKGPYFMRLINSLVPTAVPGLGTLAVTDTMVLLYDPVRLVDDHEFSALDGQGLPPKLAGGLVHEAMHILRDMSRVKELAKVDKQIANIAADIPINEDLEAAGWELPSWVVRASKYNLPKGESMEWYFQELMKNPQETKDNTTFDVMAGKCGSAAGNDDGTQAAEEAANAQGDGRSDAEVHNVRRSTADAAKKHFEGAGDTPGWVKEIVSTTRKKKERNWERELRHVVRRTTGLTQSGGSDFSYSRLSKRSYIYGMPRPGLVDQKVEVAVFWDTSGSMGQEELQKCVQVTKEVLEQLSIDHVYMAMGDTTITSDFKRTAIRDLKNIEVTGRGGTDFRPMFKRVQKLRPQPNVLLVVSDGDGPAPARPPHGLPVVWVIVPSAWSRRPTNWGHYVICSNTVEM